MFRTTGFREGAPWKPIMRTDLTARRRVWRGVARVIWACATVIVAFSPGLFAAEQSPAPPAGSTAQAPHPAPALASAPPGSAIQIAKSALLTIDATPTPDTLDLRIHKISDQSLIASDGVTVTVDGKSEPVTRVNVDTYQIPVSGIRGDGVHEIEVTVAHDGIREILSGKVTLPDTGSGDSLLRDHKQVAWWILNIVIVLIAAIAISRRKS